MGAAVRYLVADVDRAVAFYVKQLAGPSSSAARPMPDGRQEARRLGDDDADEEIFHPIAERVLARCDACLRVGGASEGADRMVAVARRLGKAVYHDIGEVP